MKSNSWLFLLIILLVQISGCPPLFPAINEPVYSDTAMLLSPDKKQFLSVAHTIIPTFARIGDKEKWVIEVEIDDKGEVYHSAATPSHLIQWPKPLIDLFCGF